MARAGTRRSKKQKRGAATPRRKRAPSRLAAAAATGGLAAIDHFVVLMLENRSFDHMLGYMKSMNPAIDGMARSDFNYENPITQANAIQVDRASVTALDFDPGHEFDEVDVQIRGPAGGRVPMGGFVYSSLGAGGSKARQVMECFQPDQLPVFTKLADEFAVFNYWYSPMPGATWPNRFFVHASTSGGLFESPSTGAMALGFRFTNGTIYDRLDAAGKFWRIYHHQDFPQAIGIRGMLRKYTRGPHFRQIRHFYSDITSGALPTYSFIEPHYDAFKDFAGGNSMHPHNDVAPGEQLIKDVYEAIRNSSYWPKTMLVVTFDEHGGFYDHVVPAAALPTGDDNRYASSDKTFAFDRYGVRVPTIVVSAYTDRQTVVGNNPDDPSTIFDHCSILATVQKRFGLRALSKRDAKANRLEVALTRNAPRDHDAPKKLPATRAVKKPLRALRRGVRGVAPSATKPLTKDQEAFLALAIAVDREMSPGKGRMGIAAAAVVNRTPAQAAAYSAQVQARALARRGELPAGKAAAARKRVVRRKETGTRKRPRGRKKG
jgi:phospholipase C